MTKRLMHRRLLPMLGLAGAGILLSPALGTSANTSTCRSDPVVTLSNGASFSLYETISDSASDIQRVAYTLHLPDGVSVTKVSYSGDVPATRQQLTWDSRNPAGTYSDTVTVTTGTPRLPMTAYAAIGPTMSLKVSGVTGQTLSMSVTVSAGTPTPTP